VAQSRPGGTLADTHEGKPGLPRGRSRLPVPGAYCAAKSAEWSLTNATRLQLAPQGTQVTALHVGYMDTDMARHISAPKSDPALVAKLALDELEGGQLEVLAEEVSRGIEGKLSGGVPALYQQFG
jgi:NAD(P)-dependent dehydrogenase (short-subunit alcohol dehydrogenase family)